MRRAFTLIEMLAVIAIMAILAAAVTVSLKGAAHAARVEDVAGRYIAFDRSTREIARRWGRKPVLWFDLNRGTLRRLETGTEPSPLTLGEGVRVTRLLLPDRAAGWGEASVPFSERGQTPSYAVLLAVPGGERWVAFAGLTGQPIVANDEREAQDIVSPSTDRADAR